MQSMRIAEAKVANALGGKTARACDSCLRRRARWFCAADDAFLCQACDTSVHSANQLASRHERVRLETSSFKSAESKGDENSPPVWHQGFTRKARTPRHNKPVKPPKDEKKIINPLPLVPEIGSEEASPDENEEQEQLLYRVPVFEPFTAELCTETSDQVENIQSDHEGAKFIAGTEFNVLLNDDEGCGCDLDIPEFIASDTKLVEFAADVESLLGTGPDEDWCGIEGLGEIECKEEDGLGVYFGDKRVKVEDEDEEVQAVIACHLDPDLESAREALNWDFDYSSTAMTGEEEELKFTIEMPMTDRESKAEEKRSIFLKLNYEAVITEWASQGSPWTNGTKPDFNPDNCWPDFMLPSHFLTEPGTGSGTFQLSYGAEGGGGRDEDREARVSRYREKRRTRLFSKKIRYEVRKLNAEKRPRMKGRFVKRTTFAGSSFPYLMNK